MSQRCYREWAGGKDCCILVFAKPNPRRKYGKNWEQHCGIVNFQFTSNRAMDGRQPEAPQVKLRIFSRNSMTHRTIRGAGLPVDPRHCHGVMLLEISLQQRCNYAVDNTFRMQRKGWFANRSILPLDPRLQGWQGYRSSSRVGWQTRALPFRITERSTVKGMEGRRCLHENSCHMAELCLTSAELQRAQRNP